MKAARQRDRREKPEREREYNRRAYRNRKADPERYATLREIDRESKRRRLGITPDRYRVIERPLRSDLLDVAPVREAVRLSGVPVLEIAGRLGKDEGAVRKVLAKERAEARPLVEILQALGLDPVDCGI